MRAGLLRHRVIVERPVETQGASGAMTIAWVMVTTVWGNVMPATTRMRERLAASQVLADADTVVTLRWSPIIEDLKALWRLRHGEIIYNIVGVANVGMRNREFEVLCVSGMNDG